MEEGVGGGGGRRRLTLLEQMSAVDHSRSRDSLAGLSLDAVQGTEKRPHHHQHQQPTRAQVNRTLLDIIRDEDHLFGHKDKKTWKAFRDKLRLKRAGSAWTSSVPIPASDIIPVQSNGHTNNHNNFPAFRNSSHSRSLMSRRNSVRFTTPGHPDEPNNGAAGRPQMTRRSSTRIGSAADPDEVNVQAVGDGPPSRSFRPQFSRHNSTRARGDSYHHGDGEDGDWESPASEGTQRLGAALTEERVMSAREAVAAQEASEAAAAAATATAAAEEEVDEEGDGGGGGEERVTMSLMDLLEETDRQMGVVGSRYAVGDDDDQEEELDDEEGEEEASGGMEYTCCVCMVRHKGSAFIPCGHTFCRLCSRELWVQRGNCPLCNGFILEILDIF